MVIYDVEKTDGLFWVSLYEEGRSPVFFDQPFKTISDTIRFVKEDVEENRFGDNYIIKGTGLGLPNTKGMIWGSV
jgi:hypothetical protein